MAEREDELRDALGDVDGRSETRPAGRRRWSPPRSAAAGCASSRSAATPSCRRRLADRRRPDAAARQRRHGAVQAVLPRRAAAAVRRARPACRSACAPSTSTRSARPPGTRRSSRCAATSRFGDYFKEGAIPLAWELLTTPVADGGYGFDPEPAVGHRLPRRRRGRRDLARQGRRARPSASSAAAWPTTTGRWACPARAARAARSTTTAARSTAREGGPVADEERYLEVWNLVFMQYERGAGGTKDDFPILGELPAKNIDTGMGLERMATILQGVDNLYEIDTTRPILDRAAELTGVALRRQTSAATCGCASSPTTRAPRRCSSATASRPATRAAATCCAGCCAASSATCGCSARTDAVMHELVAAVDRGDGRRSTRSWSPTPTRIHAVADGEEDVVPPDAATGTDAVRAGRRRGARRRALRRCPATRRSRCTTPTASRSTSPSRWRPSRASPSTRTASAGS